MNIKSLTISDTIYGLGLDADGYTLTVGGAAGISMSSGVPASTIGSKVALGTNQTWTNSSTSALTVSGVVSGTSTLAKAGAGPLRLTGDNSFTGALTISAGTFEVGGSGRLGLGTYAQTISNAGTLFINSSCPARPSPGFSPGRGPWRKAAAGPSPCREPTP